MTETKLEQHLPADPMTVFRALTNADAVAEWMVPDDMRSHVHQFEPQEGGKFRISLTYDSPDHAGKTTAHTDTYHGRFVELIPGRRVVQAIEFESSDPSMLGEMIVTLTLTELPDGGTLLEAEHRDLPAGIRPEDNELGWRLSLSKLARLVAAS